MISLRMDANVIILVTIVCFGLLSAGHATNCNSRDYGHGSTVCVCSETLSCENDLVMPISKEVEIITSYITSKSGARFLHREYRFVKEPQIQGIHSNVITIEISRSVRYQKIIGFGGAFTDSTGINIAKLPNGLQLQLIRDYFSEDGIEYSVGRIPIGGSDFSTRAYSYDDHPDGETLRTFALQQEDFNNKLPYIKMANEVSKQSVKYFGSPWGPPAWMKVHGNVTNENYLIGAPGGKYYKLFAKYFVRFLQEYAANNVTMWGLTVENEPHIGQKYPKYFCSLAMNATLERDFVKLDLGPELDKNGFENVKIMMFDDSIPKIEDWVSTILNDNDAAKYVSGIAFHWYDNRQSNMSVLDKLAREYPEQFLISSEGCEEWVGQKDKVSLGNWATFDRYAVDLMKNMNHYSNGCVDWNMVLDLEGGPNWIHNYVDAAIIVNATASEYYRQPFFYALGHFSEFIQPNSVRIHHDITRLSADLNESDIMVTVFERPDNSTVMNVLNLHNHTVTIQLYYANRGYFVTELMANSLESFVWY